MQIESYRKRMESFGQDLGLELYRYHSGHKEQVELTALYSDNSDLFSSESIQEVKTELDGTSEGFSSRRRSLKKIHQFLIDQHLEYRATSPAQELIRRMGTAAFSWNGKTVSVSRIPIQFQNESEASRRLKLSELYAGALGDTEETVHEKLSLQRSASAALGFRSYLQAREYISGVDYSGFLNAVDDALGRLDYSYLERLRVSVESTLGVPLQETGSWDVARWIKLNDPENAFPVKGLIPILKATVEELNISPETPDAIEFDLDCREGKRTRPICIPIRVPQEIKVLLCPENGSRHYGAFLHESAHAYHFAWTGASILIEDRIWGDRAVSESYAFLFERFLLEPEWLARRLSFVKSADFLRFQLLYREFLVRRYAGRLRFALQLYGEGMPGDLPYAFADIMQSYTGFLHHPEYWVTHAFDGVEAADYLRGWILECVLREYLCRRYGKAWMQNRSAAGFLKEIWETGQLYSADELAREIGAGCLDPQILADDLSGGARC